MMEVKTETVSPRGRLYKTYPCAYVEVLEHDEGTRIELCGAGPRAPRYVNIPGDGTTAYITVGGKTVDTIRWPREPRATRNKG